MLLVAGGGLEPPFLGYEPTALPLCYPAYFLLRPFFSAAASFLSRRGPAPVEVLAFGFISRQGVAEPSLFSFLVE